MSVSRCGWRLATVMLAAAAAVSACDSRPDARGLRPEPAFPIVLVVVDAMRADRAVAKHDGAPLAPALASIAKDGITFTNAFASAPKTIPSVPQILTSRYFPDLAHETTLLTLCRDAGYDATSAFIHNPYVTKWTDRLVPTFSRLGGGELDAGELTDNAIAWLDARGSDRFAMYMHYLDVHVPLRPPADIARRMVDPAYQGPIGLEFDDIKGAWRGNYDAADQRRIADLYDATVVATDRELGRLMDRLKAEKLYDRALVVVTADHGEELWEHGGFFHGHTLYDELLHVPLIVKFPGNWAGGRVVDALARTVDILPTIADLFVRASSKGAQALRADGESLVPLVTGEAAPRTHFAYVGRNDDRSPPLAAVRTKTAKLIRDMRTGAEELYDVARDPGETKNLAGSAESSAMLGELRGELDELLGMLRDTGIHVRLANGSQSPLRYEVRASSTPMVPFIDLVRFDMEDGDTLAQNPRADGMKTAGVLAPGDSDEIRFAVLTTDGTLHLEVEAAAGTPVEVCAATSACAPLADGKASFPFADLRSPSAPPARRTGSLVVEAWMLPSESAPITNVLSPADRERLRALGYAE